MIDPKDRRIERPEHVPTWLTLGDFLVERLVAVGKSRTDAILMVLASRRGWAQFHLDDVDTWEGFEDRLERERREDMHEEEGAG